MRNVESNRKFVTEKEWCKIKSDSGDRETVPFYFAPFPYTMAHWRLIAPHYFRVLNGMAGAFKYFVTKRL